MAATFVLRFLLVLCLFCLLIDVAVSRQSNSDFEQVMTKILGRKLQDASKNVSMGPTAKSSSDKPDYMLKLLLKRDPGARRGNVVNAFTDTG